MRGILFFLNRGHHRPGESETFRQNKTVEKHFVQNLISWESKVKRNILHCIASLHRYIILGRRIHC